MMNPSVLFANDDVLTQWIMTEVLREAGFAVAGACRGREVVELLKGDPEFDILLADLDLVDTEQGFDIGACWRWALPGRPVIYTGPSRLGLVQPLQLHESFLRSTRRWRKPHSGWCRR